jgi:hypothetical protein
MTYIESIKGFFGTDSFKLMKRMFYCITIIFICFFIFQHVQNKTNISMAIMETQAVFYIFLGVIYFMISDILNSPNACTNKLLTIIFFVILLCYILSYVLEKYLHVNVIGRIFIIIAISIGITIIATKVLQYVFGGKSTDYIMDSLTNSYCKNISFLVFFLIFSFIYLIVYYVYSYKSKLNEILLPSALGFMMIIIAFSFIINISSRLKIISSNDYLNSFISLCCILIFLGYMWFYTFLSSIGDICTGSESEAAVAESSNISSFLLLSILVILWLDDTPIWHQSGYFVYILVTIFTFAALFYYSLKYPSTGLLSMWLFIEWIILFSKQGGSAKNSAHFMFMNL